MNTRFISVVMIAANIAGFPLFGSSTIDLPFENQKSNTAEIRGHYEENGDKSQENSPEIVLDTEEEIKGYIATMAETHGVDKNLTLDLAKWESNYNPYAENSRSTAKGVFQWIDQSWKLYCEGNVFNAKDNIDCTIDVLKEKGGLRHWSVDPNIRQLLIKNDYL